jgi:hypothetical protein
MRPVAYWSAGALATCAMAAAPVAAAPSCGIAAAGVAPIRAAVAADARFKREGGDAQREFYASADLQAIWTFTARGSPAHPAALCEQVVDNGGAMRIERQLHCEGGKAACAAMAAEISQKDDGSGDGE